MNTFEFIQEARRDFIAAGPDGHFPCPPSHAEGFEHIFQANQRMCVAIRADETIERLDADVNFTKLQKAWEELIGEGMTYTNERGYEACVAAYDSLIVHLSPHEEPKHALVVSA